MKRRDSIKLASAATLGFWAVGEPWQETVRAGRLHLLLKAQSPFPRPPVLS